MLQPILELTRGGVIEATHFGSIAVVDSTGKLLHSYGDPDTVAFLRSSAKPFQALPFVEQGGAEYFNFTQSELSISCASHETSQLHLDTVAAMQTKIGILEGSLQCLLSGLLPSAIPAEYQLSQFSEVIIPQFNARSGHWQMS